MLVHNEHDYVIVDPPNDKIYEFLGAYKSY